MKRNKTIVVRTSLAFCIFTFISSMIFFYFSFIGAVPSMVLGICFLIITFLTYQDKYIIYPYNSTPGYFSIKVDKNKTYTFVTNSTTFKIEQPFIIVSDGCNTLIGIKCNKLVRELKKLGIKEEELS